MLESRSLRILYLGNFAQALGLQIFSPILPLYLRGSGFGSDAIGLIIAAGILGYGAAQFPSGRIADRFDRRRIIVFSLLTYGVLFLVYLLPLPFGFLVAFRFAHAAIAAAFSVASLAFVSETISPGSAGRIFSRWQALAQLGFVTGPVFGGLVAAIDPRLDFIVCAAGYILISFLMMLLPRGSGHNGRVDKAALDLDVGDDAVPVRIHRLVTVAGAGDFTVGLLTSVGSVWIISLGGAAVEVGLLFCCLALPTVLLAGHIGRSIDGSNPGLTLGLALTLLSLLGVVLGLSRHPVVAMVLVLLIGVAVAPLRPFAFAAVARSAGHLGSAGISQGKLQGGLMLVQFCAASLGGFLIDHSHFWTFASCSFASAISLIALGATRHRW